MSKPYIYSLEEFLSINHISHHYGSAMSCFQAHCDMLRTISLPGVIPSFYSIILVTEGNESYTINDSEVELKANDLLVKFPHDTLILKSCSENASSFHLLVEKNYSDEVLYQNKGIPQVNYTEIFNSFPVFHLDETKATVFQDLYRRMQQTIDRPHLFKQELLRYQLLIFQLLLVELVTGIEVNHQNLKPKDNILKRFLYLASYNFRKERQIQFYADQLNISPAYLSRIVRELTGKTVLSFLSNFLYNEICIQLKTTEKTISEIAEELNFNDQSALTNFFRGKSGVTPTDYRKRNPQALSSSVSTSASPQ